MNMNEAGNIQKGLGLTTAKLKISNLNGLIYSQFVSSH